MINFNAVTKKYSGVSAVSDVSFCVEKGEIFALLGPNGAGKTTLIKLLLNFISPTKGTVTIDKVDASDPRSRNKVGYLAELHRIPPFLTPSSYLRRTAELVDFPSSGIKEEIGRVLQLVGMESKAGQKIGTFSKGMVQRIGLAGALLGEPKLLLLDEPTSGLDPIGIREIRVLLESLKSQGVTILLNSHLLSEVEKVCDTAAIINKGQILVKDRIDHILKEGETLEDLFMRLVIGSNA